MGVLLLALLSGSHGLWIIPPRAEARYPRAGGGFPGKGRASVAAGRSTGVSEPKDSSLLQPHPSVP